jgi:hypothetical protein
MKNVCDSGTLYFPTHALVVTGQALTISIETVTDAATKSVQWYKNDVALDPTNSAYTVTNVCTTGSIKDFQKLCFYCGM